MIMDGLAPELVWGLIPRCIGLLYVLAFGALIPQHDGMPGSVHMLSVRTQLARIRRDYPGLRRFFMYPTILWLNDSEASLRAIPYVGVTCGIGMIYGGPLGVYWLALACVLWLSIEMRGVLYPWDTMLQEAGFLALFLPATLPLPDWHASALPLPTVAFMFRWLVVRLMLGFGKDKFIGTTPRDFLYLRGFFVWMPLPSVLAWFGHHSPRWFLRASLYFMFYVEVIAPFLGLFAGPLRLIAYASLVALMFGIGATGSWGYFNLGYILLCTCLLDVRSSIFDLRSTGLGGAPELAVHAAMLALFALSMVYLPTNSWFTRSWPAYPVDLFALPRKWRKLVSVIHRMLWPARVLAPFRIVNGYGVFPPNALPPVRSQLVLEGSMDGVHWKQYGYKYIPSFPHSRPAYIAPYHARLDQWTYYVSVGIDTASLFGGVLPSGNPYTAGTRYNHFDLIAQRILRGDREILRALGHNPFPDAPPRRMRVSILAMTPTSPAELRATGNWWHIRRVGTYAKPRGVDNAPAELLLPEPEQFQPEFVEAKRTAQPLRLITSAFQSGMPADSAAIAGSDLSATDVERFWNEVVPELALARGDWTRIHERGSALGARYDDFELNRFERLLERFTWLLMLRTEPHHCGEAKPELPAMGRYRFHKLLHEVVLDGRESYLETLATPARIVERAKTSSDATQLWGFALLRYDHFMTFVTVFKSTDIARLSKEWGIPGIFEYYDLFVKVVPPGEEFVPRPVLADDGEHTVDGLYPPPRWQGQVSPQS